MRELNGAWEVLRNPASRAAYDRSLRAPAVSGRVAQVADLADAVVLSPDIGPGPTSPRVPLGCLWAIGSVLALVVLAVGALALGDDPAPPLDVHTREPFGVGSCVLSSGGGTDRTLVETPCEGPHDAEVAARTVFPKACPLGLVAVLFDDNRTVVCLRMTPTR